MMLRILKRLSLIIVLMLFFPASPQAADEPRDRLLKLHEEELTAKERRVTELTHRSEIIQNQMQEDREQAKRSRERLWKEFSESLEVERTSLKDQIGALEERQRLFEIELEKTRAQDEIRTREKEDELQRFVGETKRLRVELVEDQKMLEQRRREARAAREGALKREAEGGAKSTEPGVREIEVQLGDGVVKVAEIQADEILNGTSSGVVKRLLRPEYYVEIGDVLGVDVWRAQDLTRELPVRPDGRISMPLVGDLEVVGLTLVEIKDVITRRLSEYIRNPQVSLVIKTFGGRKFIALGEFKSAGVYRFQNDISFIEALALAGGFTKEAKSGKVFILRGDLRKEPQVKIITVNVENILKRGMLTENLAILPNDILYCGKDFLGDYNDIINEFIKPTIGTAVDFFVLRSAIRTAQDRRN